MPTAFLNTPFLVFLAITALAFLVVFRPYWVKFFGPVLFYELLRISRRKRLYVIRFLYIAVLTIILGLSYQKFEDVNSPYWNAPLRAGSRASLAAIRTSQMAEFSRSFFTNFMIVQFLTVFFLTPVYTAGAIAEERDRKTLEFMLATDLDNREIVFGKLIARMANLSLIILGGLPVLSLTQLWGGVDPNLLLAGFFATAVGLLSMACISILISVFSRKSRDAIILAYLVILAYAGLSALTFYFDGLSLGNPILMLQLIDVAVRNNVPLSTVLPELMLHVAMVHGSIALVCIGWAARRLRTEALKPQVSRRSKKQRVQRRKWPRVGAHPMIWKEVLVEPGFLFNWFGRILLSAIFVLSLIPALWIGVDFLFHWLEPKSLAASRVPTRDLGESINSWVRLVGTLVACLTLLSVAFRAASTMSGEREKDTWDSLMTTPLDSNAIFTGKWIGSLLSARWALIWLGIIWAVGLVTGGLHIFTLPWLILSWSIYAVFLTLLGMRISMGKKRTTLQATVGTLFAAVALFGGHLALSLFCCVPLNGPFGTSSADTWFFRFQLYGLSPPAAISWLSFHGNDLHRGYLAASGWEDPVKIFMAIIGGLIFWSIASTFMALHNYSHFRVLTGRFPRKPAKPGAPGGYLCEGRKG